MKKIVVFILILNICLLFLAFSTHISLPFNEWRKGPSIHKFSAYSSGNAEKIFWVANALFLDTYFLIALLFYCIIKKRGIYLSQLNYFLVVIIVTTASFLIVEFAIRFYVRHSSGYSQFRPHPVLFWWNRPNLSNFVDKSDHARRTTNSFGFRYKEGIPFKKNINEYRIFVLGDSSTFGVDVTDKETFSAQMEEILNKNQEKKVRVVDAACPGHTTYQGLIILRQMIMPFCPDMVIVSYNNDPALEYVEENKRAYQNLFFEKINLIFYHSDYYLLLQRVISDYKILFLTMAKKIATPRLIPRVSLEDYENNLKEFIKLGKENNIIILFIKMPANIRTFELIPEFKKFFYNPRYPEALERICNENKQILIDVDSEWKKNPELDLFQRIHYNGLKIGAHFHPNAKGHRKIAEQICNVIFQHSLIY